MTKNEWKNLKPGDVLLEELHGRSGCYILVLANIEHHITYVQFLGLETYYVEGVVTHSVLRKVSFQLTYKGIRKL